MSGIQSWLPRWLALLILGVTAALAYGAGVSFVTLLLRSVSAAVAIYIITYGIVWYLTHILGNLARLKGGGTVAGDWEEDWGDRPKASRMTKEIPDSDHRMEDFVARQIDADIEDLLERDPARAAELMRKMQWEEGE